jgi:serine/threonine protein kinase
MTVTLETQLENYTLEKEIGRGDLTMVYQARRKSDNAIVTIKIVPPQFTFDEIFVRRFKDAARQAIKLEHPHIVSTYEAGQEEDVLYIVREYIQARTLARVIEDEGPFPVERMQRIAQQIASALDYAHQKSITHGDLSAQRVYLDTDDQAIVADFGQTQTTVGTSLVKQGFVVGAPETTAPERVHGQGPSRQSDLYSLGILCYQMLASEPPFKGSPAAVLHAQAYEQPQPLHIINPRIPVAVSETIGRMLAKGLELRYITGAEFSRALEMGMRGTAPMRAPAAAAAQMRAAGLTSVPLWQRPWVWLIGAIAFFGFLLVVGFGLVSLWSASFLVRESGSGNSAVVSQPATLTPLENAPQVEPINTPTAGGAVEVALPTTTSANVSSPPTPTPISFPTPGPPTVAEDSPFTNLVLAHAIGDNSEPEKVGTSFAPGSQPIYLFFNYEDIAPGTTWTHRWTWGDTELDSFPDVWPDSYSESGTAWVFYGPAGGFEPGPYKVTLEVEGQTVITATFVVQPGGL